MANLENSDVFEDDSKDDVIVEMKITEAEEDTEETPLIDAEGA